MDARCEKCGAAYAFDDARIPESGVSVRCTRCAHVFAVRRPPPRVAPPVPPLAAPPGRVAVPHGAGRWQLRRAQGGEVETLTELSVLHRWIVDRQVGREDALSTDGHTWHRLGDLPELGGFFQLAEGPERPAPSAPAEVVAAEALAERAPAPAEARASVAPFIVVPLVALVVGALGAAFLLRAQSASEPPAAAVAPEPSAPAPEPEVVQAAPSAQAAAPEAAPPAAASAPTAPEPSPAAAGAAAAPASATAPPTPPPAAATRKVEPPARAAEAVPAVARRTPAREFEEAVAEGDRLRERGRASAALNAYGRAADLAPTRAEPQAGRGLALLDLGSYLPAQAAFEQALRLDPRSGRALMGMAELHRAQGHRAEALRYYERYLAALPNGPEARAARAAIERLKD